MAEETGRLPGMEHDGERDRQTGEKGQDCAWENGVELCEIFHIFPRWGLVKYFTKWYNRDRK